MRQRLALWEGKASGGGGGGNKDPETWFWLHFRNFSKNKKEKKFGYSMGAGTARQILSDMKTLATIGFIVKFRKLSE